MADSFLNPQDQAQLEALKAKLTQLDVDIRGVTEQLTAEVAAMREAESGRRYATRTEGAGSARSTETAAPALRQEVEAIDQQVVSYEKLNQLISERIALETRAAAAARQTALASGVPAGRLAGSASREEALATVAPNWSQERQRILEIAGAGTAGAAGAGAGAAAEQAAATARLGAAQTGASQSARVMLASEAELRAGIQQSAIALSEYDNTLERTGALSAAAIGALANGTITVRELGSQVATTVTKFAGWTAAATAVYGALGALNEIRKGAVDTSSAVQGLTKFLPHLDRGAAEESIAQQGRATAIPLDQVGDTAQQFAKVFKNQGDVFTATHVSLEAAKLDTISLADSYKYLTAIILQSGQSVTALPGIFDQITSAQDRLGARVSQLLPAYAGAIGAVKTAGGDPNQLLGLEAATLLHTPLTGSNVATAFARGSTNFFPTAASRGILGRYGINPDQGFTQALIESLRQGPEMKAHGWEGTGAQERTLLQAFFGPRFGSRMAGLFSVTPKQLDKYLSETAPGAHPGLADQQLAKTMAQPSNQLALLKVNLQAIGAELTGSKITTPFSVLLELLNKSLQAAGDLIHTFNALPAPLKEAASWALVISGAVGTARRFNIGGSLAAKDSALAQFTAPFLSRSPEKVLQSQTNDYMSGLRGTINSQLQAASTRQMRAQLEVTKTTEELGVIQQAEGASAEAEAAASERLAAAKNALAAAMADVDFYASIGSEASMTQFRNDFLTGGGGSAGAAAVAGRGAAGGAAGTAEGAVAGAAAGAVASRTASLAVAENEALDAVFGTSLALTGFRDALAFAATSALPAFIAALLAFDLAKQSIQDTNKAYTQGVSRIQHATTADEARRGYNEVVGGGKFRIPFIGLNIPNGFGAIANLLGGRDNAASGALQAQLGYLDAQNRGFNDTLPLLQRVNQAERGGNYRSAFNQFRNDRVLKLENPGEYNKIFNDLYTKSTGEKISGGATSQNPFADWMAASQDLKNKLQPMLQSYANALKVFGTNNTDISQLAHGYAYAVAQFGRNPKDQQAMSALAQASQELKSSLDQQVQDLVSLAQMSPSGAVMVSDYMKALGDVKTQQQKIKQSFAQAEKLKPNDRPQLEAAKQKALGQSATDRQSAIQGLLSYWQSQTQLQVSKVPGIGPGADLQRAETQLRGYQSQLSGARKVGADATVLSQLLSQVNQQAITVLQDRVAYLQQLSQAETQYLQGGTADPVQQQQIAINQLRQLYTKLVGAGDHDQAQLLQVLAQERAAVLQKVAAQIGLEQAQQTTALSQMNIGQPQQVQLENALTVAQRELDYLRSLPSSQVNPQTLVQAYNTLYQAQGALAQFQIQQGEQMIQAETQLQQGRTFDPVAIARLALEGAKRLLAYDRAHHMPAAQIEQDSAQVASDYKSLQEAGWQRTEATTTFLASTYQITGAQEIRRLKSLMATMKKAHASYQEIQQVAQELWNLEYGNTGNLNLNTGAMHLPSTYEVKSAILGARQSQRRKTSAGLLADVRNDVKLTVIVNKDADAKKVYDEIQKALGTSITGLAQAAGLV